MLIVEKQLGANTLTVTRGVEEALEQMKPALAGVERRPDHLPPGDVHRDVAPEPESRTARRLRPRRPGADGVPRGLAHRPHQQRRHSAVAARGRPAAALPRWHARHDGAGGAGHRARRGRRRRHHRRREHREATAAESAAEHPQSAIKVVLDASMEVRSAVLYGSLIVVVVFLPVFMLEGLAGAFFRPLALSYVLAILASLVVALTITPALALVLLPRASRTPRVAARGRLEGAIPRACSPRSSIARRPRWRRSR